MLWRLRAVVTPFVLALVLAYLLEPLVTLLERRQVPRGAAILTVYLALGLLVALLWVSVVPSISAEVDNLARQLPAQREQWDAMVRQWSQRLRFDSLPPVVSRAADALVGQVERLLEALAARVGGLLVATVSHALNLVLTPVLAYYILKDRERLARGILALVPPCHRRHVVDLALNIDNTLASVIRGQLIVSMSVGALVAVGLMVLKVPYALLLGLVTGLLDIVPYFGPVAAGVPIVALSLAKGPMTALWAAGLLVAANQLEGAWLQPKVMSRSAGLHPLVVIGAVLTGAELAGVIGMLVAVPATSVARDVLRFFMGGRGSGAEETAPARADVPARAPEPGTPAAEGGPSPLPQG